MCIYTIVCPPDLLQLLVGSRVGHEQPVAVAHRHAAEDPAAADRGVHDGDDLVQLGLEGGVEVLAAADGHEAVGVGQLGEHAHLVVVLEVRPHHRHVCWLSFQLSCFNRGPFGYDGISGTTDRKRTD